MWIKIRDLASYIEYNFDIQVFEENLCFWWNNIEYFEYLISDFIKNNSPKKSPEISQNFPCVDKAKIKRANLKKREREVL